MSTRRARIKAVAALPPRRKNADGAASKKNQEETKEGFESEVKSILDQPASCDKPKDLEVSKDSAQEQKEGFEVGISPSKRRLSVDKQGQRRLSADKTGHVTTPKRRLSIDKTHKKTEVTPSIDNTATKPTNETNQTPLTEVHEKTPKKSKQFDEESWFPNTKILKDLLNSTESRPKNSQHLKSPALSERAFYEPKPSTSKEGNASDNEKELNRPFVPFFASPRSWSSPRRPSPIVRTPVIEVDLIAEKMIAPHKGPNSVVSERNYMEIHAADVNQKSNPEVEVIVEKINNKDETNKLDNALSTKTSKCPNKIIDEYVIKPTSETSTVMDGIVPLKPISKAPKPLDLLKNEIISENAEVLFDPIVPLPSPSKVRPKLRPVPRLGPRRNSFQQGSASESEDENRRLHRPGTPATPVPSRQRHDSHTSHAILQRDVARVRNDSVCSSVSQAQSQSFAVSSPLREREKSLKTRREEMTARRNAAMRRRQTEVERDKLTMYDLIFYNPKANPIIPDQDEINAKEANKKEEEERSEATIQGNSKTEDSPEAAPAAVPQIKLGPNGEIILDEQSLVVNQSEQRKLDASVVREGAWGGAGSRAYRRTPRTADWSDAETVRFYRALAAMGTDFTLMQPLFPTRSRRDLKLKFKKEERLNLGQVDMALRSGAEWDPSRLQTEFTKERKVAEEAALKAKERLKREKAEERERHRDMKHLRMKRSKCSKTLGESAMPRRFSQNKTTPSTLDEYAKFQQERTSRANQRRPKKKKEDLTAETTMTPISSYTLTPIDKTKPKSITPKNPPKPDMVTITKGTSLPVVPQNIETGSLVVLTVNDPKSPSRKMLQTYIAQGPGNLAPVSLPTNLLNSVVGFMKKGNSPIPTVVGSPSTRSITPNMLSPRKRTSSYTITQL